MTRNDDETPTNHHRAMPRVTEDTWLRTNIRTLVVVIGTIIGATIWMTMLYRDVQQMKADISEIKSSIREHHMAINQ